VSDCAFAHFTVAALPVLPGGVVVDHVARVRTGTNLVYQVLSDAAVFTEDRQGFDALADWPHRL